MKKLIIPGTLILLFTFFACKKKGNEPEPLTPTTPIPGVGVPDGLVKSTGGNYCSLQTNYIYYNTNGVITKDSAVFAAFYSQPPSSTLPTNVSGGTVTLNGTTITAVGDVYYISNNLPINITGSLAWNVSGSGTVTAFSQSFIPSYPKYSGGNLLPDTCIKANGITINISGVTNNQSSVSVSLYSGTSSINKYILGSSGAVSFYPSELNAFTINSSISINVIMSNQYTAILGGIKRGFANTLQYTKYSYLK